MKALSAILTKPHTFEFQEVELPPLEKHQVMLEVLSCGICPTEFAVFDGTNVGAPGTSFRYKSFPANLGHEVVGIVYQRGSEAKKFNVGDCVTGLTYSGCGFSKFFIEDENVLVKISEENRSVQKLSLGEPAMATINIIHQLQIDFGGTVAITGDGFMSLMLVAALSRYPLRKLIVIGHHQNRLQMAQKFGATHIINAKEEDAWKSVMDLTSKIGVDISVEYAGNHKALEFAASICKAKQRASLVLASSYPSNMPFTITNYLQNRAPIIIPAYPNQSKDKMKDLLAGVWGIENKLFPMESLITNQYRLEDLEKAFTDNMQRNHGYIKGIITPND